MSGLRRLTHGLVGAIAGLGLLVGASAASARVLEIATDVSPVGLDPHVVTSFASILIGGNIYEGLTAIDKDLKVVPALAESWTVGDEGKSYAFTLRQGVVFHNGTALAAGDVVASIKRVLDPKTGSPIASRFASIKDVTAGDGIVTIALSAPSAPLLAQLATLAIVPAAVIEAGGDLQKTAIGTGPFKFGQWVPDTYILLPRNEAYYDKGLPRLDGLKFNIVPEATARQVGLASGTYQFLPTVDGALALTLRGTPGVKLAETLDLAYSVVGMNTSRPPFDDVRVRLALNIALDRNRIVQAAYFGLGQPAGPLSSALVGWALPLAEFACYRTDPARARQLLAEAGHPDGLDLKLNVLGSLKIVVEAAQVVQAQLKAAGFRVTLNVQEQGQFIQDWRNSNFEAFVSLNSGGVDPDDYFTRTFRTGGSTNVFKFSDPALDAKLDTARSTADTATRQKIYREVQAQLACEGPVAHLAYGTLSTAMSAGLDGYEILATRSTRYLRQSTLK